jgi:hypothetical protein
MTVTCPCWAEVSMCIRCQQLRPAKLNYVDQRKMAKPTPIKTEGARMACTLLPQIMISILFIMWEHCNSPRPGHAAELVTALVELSCPSKWPRHPVK